MVSGSRINKSDHYQHQFEIPGNGKSEVSEEPRRLSTSTQLRLAQQHDLEMASKAAERRLQRIAIAEDIHADQED